MEKAIEKKENKNAVKKDAKKKDSNSNNRN
jgi:hypothetical protein